MVSGQASELGTVVILGTMGMVILAMGIIVFFFVYQRRIIAKESELAILALDHQKSLMDAVIQTRELEQRRIAVELHDDVGSTLTAIKFSIPTLGISSDLQEKLIANLQATIQKVRRISNDLLPSVLEELGLESATRSLVNSLDDSTDIKFMFEFRGDKFVRQRKDVELAFYRVLQELLNNILKYAGATEVQVEISIDAQQIAMIVTDNGIGFTPEDHKQQQIPSLGLRNMASRIQQINGNMVFNKLPDNGTKVTITWKI